jgi:hypothetical protein
VFGVKDSLVVSLNEVDAAQAAQYGVAVGSLVLTHDFVLVSEQATEALRDGNAMRAMAQLFPGKKVSLLDHLPVPDVD